jgi:rare lipoprotein A
MSFRTILLLGVSVLLTGCGAGYTYAPESVFIKPYYVKGCWYYPQPYYDLEEEGTASYYGGRDGCQGEPTALGEFFDMHDMTAAHRTLPLPCVILVQNLDNGKEAVLRVNDRGPYAQGRILDVSVAASKKLGFYDKGLARIRLKTLVAETLALHPTQRLRTQSLKHKKTLNHASWYVDYILKKNKL